MSKSHTSSRINLEDLAFTRGLDAEQQARIAEIASPVAWDAGATVFREGDRDSVLFVVEAGCIAIETAIPGRDE